MLLWVHLVYQLKLLNNLLHTVKTYKTVLWNDWFDRKVRLLNKKIHGNKLGIVLKIHLDQSI